MKFVLAVLIIGGVILTYNLWPSTKETSAEQTPLTFEVSPTSENVQTSRYLDYSREAFESARDKKRIYYFHAPWCPVCVPLDNEFRANAEKIPNDVVLFKTDYDSAGPLKTKYAVTYQHTFVLVDENENQIKKWNGGGIAEVIEHSQ